METYISIIRGINVGGKNLIKMDSLRELYGNLGLKNINTFIQSGNVVFQTIATHPEELEQLISDALLLQFSANITVLVRKVSEFKNVLSQNPFFNEMNIDITKLHITFLSMIPGKQFLESIEHVSYLPDKFLVIDRAIYLYCPTGYGNTMLSNNFFEKKLEVRATTRNLNTLLEIIKICDLY